jgi:L-aminopeptidase/D-esterase-like protein
VAVNALGSSTIGATRHFWAAPFELGDEFGGLGMPNPLPDNTKELRTKFSSEAAASDSANTTIGIIATDANLTKAECKRLAIAAHDGFTRAIWPSHTPMDGDLVFSVSTGKVDIGGSQDAMIEICAMAGSTMARAVARGVYLAREQDGDIMPVWRSLR